jgi:hypothetical protein
MIKIEILSIMKRNGAHLIMKKDMWKKKKKFKLSTFEV